MSGLLDVGRAIGSSLIGKAIVKPWARIAVALGERAAESKLQRFTRRVTEATPKGAAPRDFVWHALVALSEMPAPVRELDTVEALRRLGYAKRAGARDVPTLPGDEVIAEARARGLFADTAMG